MNAPRYGFRLPARLAAFALVLAVSLAASASAAEPPRKPPTPETFVDDLRPRIVLEKGPREQTLATIADRTIEVNKRIEAIGLAGLVQLKEAVPILIALLRNADDVNVKVAAVWALREIDDPAGIPALLVFHTQVTGPTPTIRYTKTISFPDTGKEMTLVELLEDAIGRLGEHVVSQYVKLLADARGSYRSQTDAAIDRQRSALAVLVCVGDRDPRAIDAMAEILKGPEEAYPADFLAAAAIGLGRILVNRTKELSAVRGSDKLGDRITELLADTVVRIEPSRTRDHIAGALAVARPTYAVTLLTRRFADNSSEAVRLRTIEALVLLRSRESVEALVWALENEKNPELRWRAAFGLGLSGKSEAALTALVKALTDESAAVRRAAIGSIGQIAGDRATELLAPSLRDEDPTIRAAAARALGAARANGAAPLLLAAADDRDVFVRSTAVAALGAFPSGENLAAIIKAARDRERPVRFAAVGVLSGIHLPAAYAALIGLVSDPDRAIQAAAKNALHIARERHPEHFKRAVIHVMGDRTNPASADACDLADFPKDPAVVEALRKASRDERPGVRASALRMLRQMKLE